MTKGLRWTKDTDRSREGAYCSLCKIKEDAAAVVLMENRYCLYSRLKNPELSGAGIIIPSRHCETPFDLTPDEWAATQELLVRAKHLVDEEFHPDGYNIGWNCVCPDAKPARRLS